MNSKFNKLTVFLSITAVVGLIGISVHHTNITNNDSFMTADLGIISNKRLDEFTGKVIVGRVAASAPIKRPTPAAKVIKKFAKVTKTIKAKKHVALEPAIKESLDLRLTAVKLGSNDKKTGARKLVDLSKGSFSGSARTADGYVESVNVNLPDGRSIDIYSNSQMSSNVWEYENENGELRSALMYESGENTFTVMLTNDTYYPGTKLEFKTESSLNKLENNQNWQMNNQDYNSSFAQAPSQQEEEQYNQEQEYDDRQEDRNYRADEESFSFKFEDQV